MKIIIAGAGAVGTHLAKLLSRERQNIILMDDDEERLSALSSNFDLMTVVASPTSIKGLEDVGTHDADLFIAVTPDESRNMTACMLASNLGAKKTVARIDNYEYLLPRNKDFFHKLGVDSLIYPEMLAAKEIVSSIRMSWVRQWWEFYGGALILIGTKMREKAEILDVPLYKLGGPTLPYHIVAIKRGNETLIPRGDDAIRMNDEYSARLMEEAARLTGLTNPNSVAQLKAWLSEETGGEVKSLNKRDMPDIVRSATSDKARRILAIRAELGKTSVKKYEAMQCVACSDGRGIGLDDDYDLLYGMGRHGRADAGKAGQRRGGGGEGIDAVVRVLKGAQLALQQNGLILLNGVVQKEGGVADKGPEPLAVGNELVEKLLGV